MTTIELLQKSVDYIEENLKCDLSLSELAETAGFSTYHFCHIFCNITGMPVAAFITKRRLYHAIYDIQKGGKLVDTALLYGDEFYSEYTQNFSNLYNELPRQTIHRDPNPSNIMFENGEVSGFIDFVISERNVRIFDPCYCATGILSEAGQIDGGFEKWGDLLKGIIYGYDDICKLTDIEKQSIPYIIYSIQMIFIAWLNGREENKNIAMQNRKMLLWIWENRNTCFNF